MARLKGIVLEESQGGRAIILSSTGEFRKVKIKGPVEIGEFYEAPVISPWQYALVAGFILALLWGGWDYNSVQAYAQLSPSLELGVNRWSRVIEVKSLDENGEKVVQESPLVGQRVDQAVETVVDQAIEEGSIEQMIDVKEVMERETESPDIESADEPKNEKYTKVFPVQAADKGKKDEAFIKEVEANMNQGLQKSLDKHKDRLERDKNKNIPSRGSKVRDQVPGRNK